MKILVTSMNFSPELIGIGKYSSEMVRWFSLNGHEVKVICSQPYYPRWKIFEGYSTFLYSREKFFFHDKSNDCEEKKISCQIYRCPIWVPKNPTGIKRILHLFSFMFSMIPVMLGQIFWRPNVIITIAPSLISSPIALLFAKVSKAKSILHIQDFEIDVAFNLGLIKSQLLRQLLLKIECLILKKFDLVSTISTRMIKNLHLKGLTEKSTRLIPNWVDLKAIQPFTDSSLIENSRDLFGIKKDFFVALYAGNMGNKQGLDILTKTLKALANEKIIFIFCGEGSYRSKLEVQCSNLPNVIFLPIQPVEVFNKLLCIADIHLLPQIEKVADFLMPSKLLGILASGRPTVSNSRNNTEVGEILSTCGLISEPDDHVGFTNAIIRLMQDEPLRINLGKMARLYAERNFSYDEIMLKFEYEIKASLFKITN